MAADRHHVIIGNGVAGVRAATVLRERDPDNRITIISIGGLLFYDRYQLPQVFEGKRDWRAYLVHPPDYYDDRRITVRRKCRVTQIDPRRRVLMLAHREEVGYDTLLIASGGGSYLPPRLSEYKPLFNYFGTYSAALATAAALPEGGTAILLGGDILGIDVAHAIAATGRRVILLASEQLFWPHKVAPEDRAPLIEALEQAGIEVVDDGAIERIEGGTNGAPGAACGAGRRPRHRRRRGDAVLRSDAVARVHGRLRRRHRARPAGQPDAQDHRCSCLGSGRRLPDLERRGQRVPLLLRLEERQGDGRACRAQHQRRRGAVSDLG